VSSLEEFRACNKAQQDPAMQIATAQVQLRSFWQPLPPGVVKLNWDASLIKEEGRIGLGLIARDCCGDVLGARCISKILRVDPKLAEAMAALYAVQFCLQLGFFEVIFEGGAQEAGSEEVNSNPPYLFRIGHFIESIILKVRQCKSSLSVFAHRSKNSAAHILAREATFNNVNDTLLEDIPRSIAHIVTRESVPIS
jgi:hypothetical protein